MYVFPGISSLKRKASFLAYMVNGLLLAYIEHRRCDNRDDFRNKRLELATKLLKHELKVIPGIFFTLGASSDEEVVDLIGCSNDEARIHNILFASVRDADKKCGALWRNRNAV
ncbi:DNA-directed RNA polymerases IV and V subunit 2, partial [Mucuna pruriens]